MDSTPRDNHKIVLTINMFFIFLILLLFFIRRIYNFDFILLFISIFMLMCLFNYKPYLFLKYFCNIFYCIYMLVGVFLCDNTNLYLYEIEKISHYNGSFSLVILYFIIFFLSIMMFEKKITKNIKYYLSEEKVKKNKNNSKFIYYIFFIVGLIMFLFVAKNPSFASHFDRFNYKSYYLPKWVSSLQSNMTYCIPLLLLPAIYNNKKINFKLICKILFILSPFILYGIWTGNKFGLFLKIFIALASPAIVYIGKKNLKHSKMESLNVEEKFLKESNFKIKKTLLLTLAIFIILLLPYYLLRNLNFSESMINRAAQQGQLWWATFEIEQNNTMHINELNDEIKPILESFNGDTISDSYGIYKIMKLTTPYKTYLNKLANGSRYSAQGIDIAFYYFKYVGIIMHAILRAFVEVALVNLLIKFVFSCRVIETYIISKLIIIEHFIFTQGDLYMLFSKVNIFLILVLIFLELLYKKNNNFRTIYGNK